MICLAGPVAADGVLSSAEVLPKAVGAERCFARSYSAAHLKRHPKQRVTDMALILDYTKFDGSDELYFTFSVAVKRRGEAVRGTNLGMCHDGDLGIVCRIECDGGGFLLRRGKNGAVLMDMTHIWGMALSACGGDEAQYLEPLKAGADDKVFRLDPAEMKRCDVARIK